MKDEIFLVRPARCEDGHVPTREVMNINDPGGSLIFEEIFHSEKDGREMLSRFSKPGTTLYRAKIVEITEVEAISGDDSDGD